MSDIEKCSDEQNDSSFLLEGGNDDHPFKSEQENAGPGDAIDIAIKTVIDQGDDYMCLREHGNRKINLVEDTSNIFRFYDQKSYEM